MVVDGWSSETGPEHPEEPFSPTSLAFCSFLRVPPETIWQTIVKKKETPREENNKSLLSHPLPICRAILFFYYQRRVRPLGFSVRRSWQCVDVGRTLKKNNQIKDYGALRVEMGGKIPPPCASNRPFTSSLMTCQFPCPSIFCPINSFLALRIKGDNAGPPQHNESLKFSSFGLALGTLTRPGWARLLGMHASANMNILPTDQGTGHHFSSTSLVEC